MCLSTAGHRYGSGSTMFLTVLDDSTTTWSFSWWGVNTWYFQFWARRACPLPGAELSARYWDEQPIPLAPVPQCSSGGMRKGVTTLVKSDSRCPGMWQQSGIWLLPLRICLRPWLAALRRDHETVSEITAWSRSSFRVLARGIIHVLGSEVYNPIQCNWACSSYPLPNL